MLCCFVQFIIVISIFIEVLSQHHWLRLVKNIGWANQNIGGQKVVKSDKCMGILNYWKGHMPGLPPKSTPMVSIEYINRAKFLVKMTAFNAIITVWKFNEIITIGEKHRLRYKNVFTFLIFKIKNGFCSVFIS